MSLLTVRTLPGWLGLALSVTVVGCTHSPVQPSGAVSGAVSIAAPSPAAPANGAFVAGTLPIVLVVQNAIVTGSGSTTYTFEVATDSGFASKAQVKDGVPQGSGGQTSVTLDALPAGKDYYWHVRAQSGDTTGVFGATAKFTIVTIGAPTAVSPLSGSIVNGWPTLTVSNATRTVQTGALVYRFEIATDAGFSSIIVRGTVSETANQTRFAPPGQPLPVQTDLFWRATATDQSNGTSSPASAVQSYTSNITPQSQLAALEGISLWSDIQPPGSNGRATLGDSWNVQNVVAFPSGIVHLTPTVDELRVFDLLDRGLDPQGAIDWMNSHGYRTNAAVYASVNVIGFDFEYMAFVRGRWDLVFKIE